MEGGYAYKHKEEEAKKSSSTMHKVFKSRVMHSIVPMASVQINSHEIRLAEPCLAKLKELDMLVGNSDDDKMIRQGCDKFLREFGSHINTGTIHLGGIYELDTRYSSEQS